MGPASDPLTSSALTAVAPAGNQHGGLRIPTIDWTSDCQQMEIGCGPCDTDGGQVHVGTEEFDNPGTRVSQNSLSLFLIFGRGIY